MTREAAQGVIARIETLPKLSEATRSLVGAATFAGLGILVASRAKKRRDEGRTDRRARPIACGVDFYKEDFHRAPRLAWN